MLHDIEAFLKLNFIVPDIANKCVTYFLACQVATDLGFVLPVSANIKDTEWRDVQNFVKGVANAFNISYLGTHVGVLSYSSQATMEMKFNRYYFQSDVLNAIDNIYPEAKSNQGTKLDDALEIANYELFTTSGGSRGDITKSLVVLVSSKLADEKIRRIVGKLKGTGVTTVAIGVGPAVSRDNLLKIADSNHTFSVGAYYDLVPVVEKVVKSMCKGKIQIKSRLESLNKARLSFNTF